MKNLKMVVVGPGLIGKKHIAMIQSRSDTELVAIVAPDRIHNHDVAKQLGVRLYNSLEDCLDCEAPDGVIIASPNRFHFEHAQSCIIRGIPALVEKPIASSTAEAMKIVELSDEHCTAVMVGHHRAHSPIMRIARSILNTGRLGRLVTVSGSAQFAKPMQYFKDGPWRAQSGGGPILINLIHEIGNLRALCGEIREVQAMCSSRVRGFEVEDTVAINIQFVNGVLGTFLLSDCAASTRSWEQTSGENPAYPRDDGEDCYLVAGTLGSLSIPSMKLRFFPNDSEPSWWTKWSEEVTPVPVGDPLEHQLANFVEVIRGDAAPIVSARDGLQNLLVTEAIHVSALTRRIVTLESGYDAVVLRDAGNRSDYGSAEMLAGRRALNAFN